MPTSLAELESLARRWLFEREDFVQRDGVGMIPNTTVVVEEDLRFELAQMPAWELEVLAQEVRTRYPHCDINPISVIVIVPEIIIDTLRTHEIREVEHNRERLVATIR